MVRPGPGGPVRGLTRSTPYRAFQDQGAGLEGEQSRGPHRRRPSISLSGWGVSPDNEVTPGASTSRSDRPHITRSSTSPPLSNASRPGVGPLTTAPPENRLQAGRSQPDTGARLPSHDPRHRHHGLSCGPLKYLFLAAHSCPRYVPSPCLAQWRPEVRVRIPQLGKLSIRTPLLPGQPPVLIRFLEHGPQGCSLCRLPADRV